MNSAKHTPGPWKNERGLIWSDVHCSKDTGYLAIVKDPTRSTQGCFNGESIDSSEKIFQANARLIAKAPEMLELLEEFADQFETIMRITDGSFDGHVYKKIRALLAELEE